MDVLLRYSALLAMFAPVVIFWGSTMPGMFSPIAVGPRGNALPAANGAAWATWIVGRSAVLQPIRPWAGARRE